MLQKILAAFWKQHNLIMQEVLIVQGGDNGGTFYVYF